MRKEERWKSRKRNSIIRGIIDGQRRREEQAINRTRNEGPNLRFRAYLDNYIKTILNGTKPTKEQIKEIILAFLNEKENESYKNIYSVEVIERWVPGYIREDDENER